MPSPPQNIDGLVQERRNSSALAMELHLSCMSPSLYRNQNDHSTTSHLSPLKWPLPSSRIYFHNNDPLPLPQHTPLPPYECTIRQNASLSTAISFPPHHISPLRCNTSILTGIPLHHNTAIHLSPQEYPIHITSFFSVAIHLSPQECLFTMSHFSRREWHHNTSLCTGMFPP